MSELVGVVWSATVQDDADFLGGLAKNHTTLLQPWAAMPSYGSEAVQAIIEDWLDDERWAEFFGDDSSAGLLVEIHSPSSIAARYGVDAERVTKARAWRKPWAGRRVA